MQQFNDVTSFERLALLGPAEYDRCRRAEAKRLHLRIETLDTEVAKCRAELDLQAQANAVQLPAIELWPEPVDGPEVLDQVGDLIQGARVTGRRLMLNGASFGRSWTSSRCRFSSCPATTISATGYLVTETLAA